MFAEVVHSYRIGTSYARFKKITDPTIGLKIVQIVQKDSKGYTLKAVLRIFISLTYDTNLFIFEVNRWN